MVMAIPLQKTVQFSERLHEVAMASSPGSVLCPVKALDDIIALRGLSSISVNDLVFQLPDGAGGWRPLVKYEFKNWLDHRIYQMNLPPNRYLVHGFRHGSLSHAILCEPNLELIRVSSNHLGNSIHVYNNVPASKRFQVTQKMLSSIAKNLS